MEDMAKNCKANIRLIMKEGEKQQKEDKEASQDRCARLKQDVQHLRTQLNALVLEHRASELVLRKVKGRSSGTGGLSLFAELSALAAACCKEFLGLCSFLAGCTRCLSEHTRPVLILC